jgi:hypothetical protein
LVKFPQFPINAPDKTGFNPVIWFKHSSLLVSYSIAKEIADTPIPGADIMVTGILMVSPGWQLVDV